MAYVVYVAERCDAAAPMSPAPVCVLAGVGLAGWGAWTCRPISMKASGSNAEPSSSLRLLATLLCATPHNIRVAAPSAVALGTRHLPPHKYPNADNHVCLTTSLIPLLCPNLALSTTPVP